MYLEYIDVAIKFAQISLVPAIWAGILVLRGIREQLSMLNGRMIRQEQWSDGHEKLDKERFEDLGDQISRLREDMHRYGGTPARSRR